MIKNNIVSTLQFIPSHLDALLVTLKQGNLIETVAADHASTVHHMTEEKVYSYYKHTCIPCGVLDVNSGSK